MSGCVQPLVAAFDKIRRSGTVQVIERVLPADFFLGFINFNAKTQEQDMVFYISHNYCSSGKVISPDLP
jgi:hypothetical protein